MHIIELDESQKKTYNRFVANQPTGSFLQSWEWGEWLESRGQEVVRGWVVGDDPNNNNKNNDNPIASLQLVRMPMFRNKFYWYAPYGPVINPSYADQAIAIVTALQQYFAAAVFLRIEPLQKISGLQTIAKKTVNIQPAITMVVDLQKTEAELLSAMHPKTRYNIKVAEKHGVMVQSELVITPEKGLYVKEAIDLMLQTQQRQKYRGHSGEYYKNLINFFGLKNSQNDLKVVIYKALYNKQLLATGIMVDFGTTRIYLYGGSSETERNVMAPYIMHWQAIKDARASGLAFYDLGGSEVAAGGEKGFTRFKQGFGGRVVEYAGAHDIIFNSLWYTIYTGARKINRLANALKIRKSEVG